MTNNDILRRLRYAFDFSDKQFNALFSTDPACSVSLSLADTKQRLLKPEDEGFQACSDNELSAFLDGLIASKRGLQERPKQAPISELSRNDILRKLRIAMNYRDDDMLETLRLSGSPLSKPELSALFRRPGHKHYRKCGQQVLRNFIKGLTITLRPDSKTSN